MSVAVLTIHHPPTSMTILGPRDRTIQYRCARASGAASAVNTEAFFGPFDTGMQETINFQVSVAGASGDAYRMTVLGSYSNNTVTPTERLWFVARGETASGQAGLNNGVFEITCGTPVFITTQARSYLLKISSVSSMNGGAINVRVLTVKSNW